MNNLEALKNEEVDKIAAEMMGEVYQVNGVSMLKMEGHRTISLAEFNPTQDAEQIQRYLFPKLHDKGFRYSVWWPNGHFENQWTHKTLGTFISSCDDPDQINRTKTICWIKAMDMLE